MRLEITQEQLPPSEVLPGIEDGQVVYHNGEGYYYICDEFNQHIKERLLKCVKKDCKATAKMGPMQLGFPLIDLGCHSHSPDFHYKQKCILLHTIRRKFIIEDVPAFAILQNVLKSYCSRENIQLNTLEEMQVSTNQSEEQIFMDFLGEDSACIASVPRVDEHLPSNPTRTEEPRLTVQHASQTYERRNARRAIILNVENSKQLLDNNIDFSNTNHMDICATETDDHKTEIPNSSALQSEIVSLPSPGTIQNPFSDPGELSVLNDESFSENIKEEPPDNVEFVDVGADMSEQMYNMVEGNNENQIPKTMLKVVPSSAGLQLIPTTSLLKSSALGDIPDPPAFTPPHTSCKKNNSGKEESFEKQCLTKLNFLVIKVKRIAEDINKLEGKTKTMKALPDLEDEFPLKSLEGLEDFEDRCRKNRNLIISCVGIFKAIGGDSLLQVTTNVLKKLMAPQLAVMFSFLGRKKKKTFKDLSLNKIVTGVARAHYASATESEIAAIVSRWLIQSRLRLERFEKKKENEVQNQNENQ